MGQQDVQYARTVSDVTLKNKGAYDDNMRINRKLKRKQKKGINWDCLFYVESKKLEKMN